VALPLFAMQCKNIRAAFTLIEVILCIALIAIAVGLVSVWTVPSDETLGRKTPERALASAIKFARIDALKNGRELSIYYSKNGYFSIQDTETKAEKSRIYLNPEQEKAEKKSDSVRKYKSLGYNGLINTQRGRPKKEPNMKKNNMPAQLTESEREELIRLRAEVEYIKAENEVIKKEIALREEKEAARLKAKKQRLSKNSVTKGTN